MVGIIYLWELDRKYLQINANKDRLRTGVLKANKVAFTDLFLSANMHV